MICEQLDGDTMFVYFILGDVCKRTSYVTIDLEKCVPQVGTYTEGSVDPTLWYKVLAIDSILIDCDISAAWWTAEKLDFGRSFKGSQRQDMDAAVVRHRFRGQEKLFGESVELSPSLAELLEAAEQIFNSLSPEVIDRVGNVPMYKNLIRIIHVYILPEVKFEESHEATVERVLTTVEKECENIEMLIKMTVQSKKNTEEELTKERRRILNKEGVINILKNPSPDDDVIRLLLRHSEKDIRRLEDTLSRLTDKITPLRNAKDELGVKILKDTRKLRDAVAREREEIILAKEEIVNDIILRRSEKSRKAKRPTLKKARPSCRERKSDILDNYKAKSADIDTLSNEIKNQINTKIKLSSIREAACLTAKEIRTDGFSYGYNRKKGSLEVEADLFDPTKKPREWTTLNEQVAAYLQANHSDLGAKHEQFCAIVKEHCKTLIEKAKRDFLINNGTLDGGRLAISLRSSPADQGGDNALRLSTRWLFGYVPKEDCEALSKQISDHISDMADAIGVEIQGNNNILTSFHTQVYICYEEHVSNELIPVLSKLYEHSFRQHCKTLSTWITECSATELETLNNTLKGLFPNLQKSGDHTCHVQKRPTQRSVSFMEKSGGFSRTIGRTLSFLSGRNKEVISDPSEKSEHEQLDIHLKSVFGAFFTIIKEEDAAISIFSKLRHLTRAIQSAQQTFSDLLKDLGKQTDLATDDILDILVLLVCRLDPESLLKLYAHVNLILHLSPYFLEGNINEFALVSLIGAYQHLFERQEMHESFQQQQEQQQQQQQQMFNHQNLNFTISE